MIRKLFLLLPVILLVIKNYGQTPDAGAAGKVTETDMEGVMHHLFQPHKPLPPDSGAIKDTRKHFSFVPAVGYTLQTGFAGIVSGNMAWYNDVKGDTKISSVNTNVTYSQYRQIIVPFQVNVWTKGNQYNIITDFRFISG